MSFYHKHERPAVFAQMNGEKKVFKAFVSAELKPLPLNAEAQLCDLKSSLTVSKTHSSATLLRKKLKGHLVRELHEI